MNGVNKYSLLYSQEVYELSVNDYKNVHECLKVVMWDIYMYI